MLSTIKHLSTQMSSIDVMSKSVQNDGCTTLLPLTWNLIPRTVHCHIQFHSSVFFFVFCAITAIFSRWIFFFLSYFFFIFYVCELVSFFGILSSQPIDAFICRHRFLKLVTADIIRSKTIKMSFIVKETCVSFVFFFFLFYHILMLRPFCVRIL